jgi:hypothetical protein
LDFSQPPREPFFISFSREPDKLPPEPRRGVIYIAYGAAIVFAAVTLTIVRITDKKETVERITKVNARRGGGA